MNQFRVAQCGWSTSVVLENAYPTVHGLIFVNNTTVKMFWISGGGFNVINIVGNYGNVSYDRTNARLSCTWNQNATMTIVAFYP